MLSSKWFRLLLTLLVVAGFISAAIASYRSSRMEVTTHDDGLLVGQWEFLSDIPWKNAETAWVAVANEGLPALDRSFIEGPISLGGQAYEKGIGTYPLSEIEYSLGGEYIFFESDVGVDDSVPQGRGGVIFQVYLDGAIVFDSGAVKSGDPPVHVKLPLLGIETMKLVAVDATEGTVRNFANWAQARVLRRLVTVADIKSSPILDFVRERNQLRKNQREKAKKNLAALAEDEFTSFRHGLGEADESGITSALDGTRKLLQLGNSKLGIELGYGGGRHGYLTILDLEDERLVVHNAFAGVSLNGTGVIDIPTDTEPVEGGYHFEDVEDPVFGPGVRLEADFKAKDDPATVVVELTLFRDSRYLLYRLRLEDVVHIAEPPPTFSYFKADKDSLVVDDNVEYISDFSRLRRAVVHDDDVARGEKIGQGKPVFIWSNSTSKGFLAAALDETELAPSVKVQLSPGQVVAKLDYTAPATRESLSSPRLYVEATNTVDSRRAFDDFKRFFAALYPPLPMPGWVKYQWLSWYPYMMDISDETLRSQIDYIAEFFADLGPWHIIVDAGWYVAEGRPGAEWRNVDYAKFPRGLRSFVDYAHSRDVKVVLYVSTPYIDSREEPGDWLGLRGIIDNHRDWLLPIGESDDRESFVYDYTNPEFRDYMDQVFRDFFIRYDVDGMKVDGLGNAGGALLDPDRIDPFGLVDRVVGPTMDIYRFNYETAFALKDDIYVESGWSTPLFANSYAHTFRFGDEADEFTSIYPFPGLVEHIDYAQVQKMVLGQRSNMGALRGDPNLSSVNRWMLEAALALGTQTVLSYYLPAMEDETLSFYRGLLYHYNAFEGETYFGSPLFSDTFATTVRGTTYLGVLNRKTLNQDFRLRLADFGLTPGLNYTVFSVEENKYMRVRDSLNLSLPPQSFALFIIRSEPGVIWTNSSVDYEETDSEIILKIRGPQSLPGLVQVLVNRHRAVSLDGRQLRRQTTQTATEGTYQYDAQTRIITLRYDHQTEHEIRIVK